MRVCVLYCGRQPNDRNLAELASKLAEGIASNGHTVDVFDMNLEMGKIISFYDYVAVITTAVSFFSKNIPDNVMKFLKAAGSVSGKRCSCYISKNCGRKGSQVCPRSRLKIQVTTVTATIPIRPAMVGNAWVNLWA